MKPLSLVARTVCNLFAWFMIIFGVVVIVHGDLTPGGGFQGGAIVASFMVLILVAHGGEKILKWVIIPIYWVIMLSGLLMFIGLAFAGMSHSTFFYNFASHPLSVSSGMVPTIVPFSGTIGLMDIAVGLEVTGGLTIIMLTIYRWAMTDISKESRKETGYDS